MAKAKGRPSVYSKKTAEEVCRQLAEGKSLREICRSEDMPHESTVRLWAVQDKNGFSTQYANARRIQALYWADELLEIVDDGSNDWMERNEKDNPGFTVNGDAVARSRLRADTRKWLLSKVLPKVYGDKLDLKGKLLIKPVGEMTEEECLEFLGDEA
jgi:hypothetical protein